MDHFINVMTKKKDFSPIERYLMVLDGHKSHISLAVLQKAREKELDMISLPCHTSHALQPLDVVCFGTFKKAFRAHRDLWIMEGKGKVVKKEHLAQWASLALKKALTSTNFKAGFRACGIWPLNYTAMQGKMQSSARFQNQPLN